MSRIKAFLIHLGISAIIFFILLYLIVFHWYPGFLFTADGGWQGVRIIAGVDLVLGPLLTLIVFKAGKPSLKFDLSVIALVQACALTWGIWVTYSERPYAIVYSYDFFKPIPRSQITDAEHLKKIDELAGDDEPRLIYNNLPVDHIEFAKLRAEARKSREPLYMFYEYYSRFTKDSIPIIKKQSYDLKYILGKEKDLPENIKEKLTYYSDKKNYLLFHISSRYEKKYTVVFDTNTFKIVDTINYDLSKYLYVIRLPKNKPAQPN